MYFHVTTRCNMACAHCCFAATGKGEDMDPELFRRALTKWAEPINKAGKHVVLGGGEPTIHPDFWKLLLIAQAFGRPWLATNGKQTETALMLSQMALHGNVSVVLSQDVWHDPIEPSVVDAFRKDLEAHPTPWYNEWYAKDATTDKRGIRNVIIPIEGGRSRGMNELRKGCPCPGIHVYPDGSLVACGCDDAPIIGTVEGGVADIQYKYYSLFDSCFKSPSPVFNPGVTDDRAVAAE